MSRSLADLAWAIGAPPICAPTSRWVSAEHSRRELVEHRKWLTGLDPQELDAFVDTIGARRLGLYFEALHAFWFARSPYRTLLADHVPVRQNKNTLGELDFVYQDESGTVHTEIAIKFYLRVETGHSLASYVGPSLRDRLDWKLDTIARKQSRRLELPETRRILADLGIDAERIRTEIRLKGVLFQRPSEVASSPEPIDHECLSGVWMTAAEFASYYEATEGWCVLERLEWMTGPRRAGTELSSESIGRMLAREASPVQLCRSLDGTIVQRVFIVPEDWGLRAQEFAAASPNRAAALQW